MFQEAPARIEWDTLAGFTPKQKEAEDATDKYKYIFYGGAMGGGKSRWLRWQLVKLLLQYAADGHKGVRVGLFCEDYPALKDRHLSKLEYEFPQWLGVLNKGDYEYALYSEYGGGIICFRNLDDPSKYQSAEFAAIGVDELTKNSREVFDFLRTRLRWPKIENTKFLAASNPGGIGHAWVKKMWITRDFEEGEPEKDQFRFIPAKAVDNPYLPKSYFLSLEGLPAEMRKAFVEGNWDLFKGQYFTEWNIEKHVTNPFLIPDSWKKFRAYDHGRENPACCKWYALDYDGRLWVYRELYIKGLNADQIAERITTMSGNEQYVFSVADNSIFAKQGFVDRWGGETLAATFASNGVGFIPSSKSRIAGWNLMHQYLKWDANNPPKMIYFNTCFDSIRTIPSLVHDIHRPEDLETNSEDHAADTDRYLLQMLHDQHTPQPMTEIEKILFAKKQEQESVFNKYTEEL